MQTGANRQSALDGMRGIAALSVFAVHLWIYQLPNTVDVRRDTWAKAALFEGRVAFVMFFVLSGFLLYRAFARAALPGGRPVATGGYLVRRAARVMPAYYLAIAGTLLLLTLAGSDVPGRRLVDAAKIPLYLVFAQNYSADTLLKLNAATWTLCVEVAFYLVLPLIGFAVLRVAKGRPWRQVALLTLLGLAGLGWNLVDYLSGWGPWGGHAPPSFLPYFACGMLVALAAEQFRTSGRSLGRGQTIALVATAVALIGANGAWHALDRASSGFTMEVFADLAAAAGFAALIAAIVLGTGSGVRWLAWAPLAWIGQITYGLYLWHIPIIVFARGNGLLPGGALSALVALPLAIAMGAASWYLVERPAMRRAARLRRTAPATSTEARSERSRSRSRARIAPRPASLSARAADAPR